MHDAPPDGPHGLLACRHRTTRCFAGLSSWCLAPAWLVTLLGRSGHHRRAAGNTGGTHAPCSHAPWVCPCCLHRGRRLLGCLAQGELGSGRLLIAQTRVAHGSCNDCSCALELPFLYCLGEQHRTACCALCVSWSSQSEGNVVGVPNIGSKVATNDCVEVAARPVRSGLHESGSSVAGDGIITCNLGHARMPFRALAW